MHLAPPLLAAAVVAAGFTHQSPSPPQDKQPASPASRPQPSADQHRDVYHVLEVRAAPGRLGDLLMMASSPPPAGRSTFSVAFRHAQGQSWDLLVIEHLGDKATIQRREPDPGLQEQRAVTASHTDSFALGPPVAEFRRQLGLEKTAVASGPPVDIYIVSTFNAVPGHQPQLQQALLRTLPGTGTSGNVLLTHLEGAPWHMMLISHYASWHELAKAMTAPPGPQVQQAGQAPTSLREHMDSHADTIAFPIAIHATAGSNPRRACG